jgi:hypothetical protein
VIISFIEEKTGQILYNFLVHEVVDKEIVVFEQFLDQVELA